MRDKTLNDRFFILILFAITYDIESNCTYLAKKIIDVQLLMDFPPAHYAKQRKKFEAYFTRNKFIEFRFNDRGILHLY